MAKRGPKREPQQRERDLIIVSQMYLRGDTQQAMADAVSANYEGLSVTRQQISYDIKELHRRWVKEQIINIDAAKARELARVDKLEREAWDAWERSQQDAETITTEKAVLAKGADADKRAKEVHRREGQVGDPRFLSVIEWCIERRAKLLGLDAPTKQQSENLNIDMGQLTDDQLQRIANGEDPIHVLATTEGAGPD